VKSEAPRAILAAQMVANHTIYVLNTWLEMSCALPADMCKARLSPAWEHRTANSEAQRQQYK
jgi:hypothetical protein